MKGIFLVQEVVEEAPGHFVLQGTVCSGTIQVGMESRTNTVIIIGEIRSTTKNKGILKQARKGQQVIIEPKRTVYELLKPLEGIELEFEDVRSIPIKDVLVLDPGPA